MEKSKALELLKQELGKVSHLRETHYDNQEFELWRYQVGDIIKAVLDSEDYNRFSSAAGPVTKFSSTTPDNIKLDAYQRKLTKYETALKSIIQKYERLDLGIPPENKSNENTNIIEPEALFDGMKFHPKIIEVSRGLFKDGHYRDAIYRAFVEVNNLVKDKANSQLDGRRLMSTVFSLDNPIIKLNPLKTQSDKDEQEGFMFLFMGAMEGIRNPKAHENIIQNDPHRALEYLSFASLLIETIDFWEVD